MKNIVFTLIAVVIILTGCTTTTTVVEYNEDGKPIKQITTEADVVSKVMDEMKVKDIAWYKCGWFFNIELTMLSSETFVPTIRFSGANANTGHITLTKDSKQDMAEAITAMQNVLQVDVTGQGIKIKEE